MLGDLGYQVLKATDANSALSVIESGIPIDILFTDVVMPGRLKSPELARKARERLPDLAVLFTSGYTENSIVHGGKLDAGVELLSKPYTREALARKFQHVLANQRQKRKAAATPVPAKLPAREDAPQGSSSRPMVLLVEDDVLIRMNTAELLEIHGVGVIEAGSAEEAMTALQATAIDILVTDVNLPGLSGPELAVKARALQPSIGIVFATGDSQAVAELADASTIILSKPYTSKNLAAAVRAALGKSGDGEAAPDQLSPNEGQEPV
jgi:CheY-like chemotaxis protein